MRDFSYSYGTVTAIAKKAGQAGVLVVVIASLVSIVPAWSNLNESSLAEYGGMGCSLTCVSGLCCRIGGTFGFAYGAFHIAGLLGSVVPQSNSGNGQRDGRDGENSGKRHQPVSIQSQRRVSFIFLGGVFGGAIHLTGWVLLIFGYWLGWPIMIVGGLLAVYGPLCLSFDWMPFSFYWRAM